MLTVKQYEELVRQAERGNKDAERAAGARQQLMKQLKEKFGCRTVEQAEKLLDKRQKQRDKAQEAAERLLAEFEEAYGELLRED
jgi:hypothetical protein